MQIVLGLRLFKLYISLDFIPPPPPSQNWQFVVFKNVTDGIAYYIFSPLFDFGQIKHIYRGLKQLSGPYSSSLLLRDGGD